MVLGDGNVKFAEDLEEDLFHKEAGDMEVELDMNLVNNPDPQNQGAKATSEERAETSDTERITYQDRPQNTLGPNLAATQEYGPRVLLAQLNANPLMRNSQVGQTRPTASRDTSGLRKENLISLRHPLSIGKSPTQAGPIANQPHHAQVMSANQSLSMDAQRSVEGIPETKCSLTLKRPTKE